jgi:hypothetical protein
MLVRNSLSVGKLNACAEGDCPGWPSSAPADPLVDLLSLVADLAQQIVAPGHICLALYTFRGAAIDDTEHTLTLFTPSDNDLHRISRRAEDRTPLRARCG